MQRHLSLRRKVTKQNVATHRDPRVGAADPQILRRLLMSEVAEIVWFLRYHLSGPFPARDSTKAYEQDILDVACRSLCVRSAKWLRHICATRSTLAACSVAIDKKRADILVVLQDAGDWHLDAVVGTFRTELCGVL